MRLQCGQYFGPSFALLVSGFLVALQDVDADDKFKCMGMTRLRGHMNGSIQSPNYPHSYTSNKCSWLITVPPNHNIRLTFVAFELLSCSVSRCACDFLEVRDGDSSRSPLISRDCGRRPAMPLIYSTSNQLWVRYRSMGSFADGFRAHFKALKIYKRLPRVQHIVKSNGSIVSPYTLVSCGFKRRCTWIVHAPSKPCIAINFPVFRLRPQKCGREFVEVRDGLNSSSAIIGRFCGDSKPTTLVSTGDALFIRFKYNASTDLTVYGFSATFYETSECGLGDGDATTGNPEVLNAMTQLPDRKSVVVGIVCTCVFLLVLLIVCVIKIVNRDFDGGHAASAPAVARARAAPLAREEYVKLQRHSVRVGSSLSGRSDTLITETEVDPEYAEKYVKLQRHSVRVGSSLSGRSDPLITESGVEPEYAEY